jgi:hypothetical protein
MEFDQTTLFLYVKHDYSISAEVRVFCRVL